MNVIAQPRPIQPDARQQHSGFDFVPRDNARAARSIRRRNRWLSIMVWVAAGGLLGLVGMFLFYAGVFDASVPAAPEVGEREAIAETLTLGDLHFTGYDSRNQPYAISADAAEQDVENPNVIHLDRVRAELKIEGSGDIVLVRADHGIYDSDQDTLRLHTNIKVITTNGFTAWLETADISLGEGYVVSDDPVVVTTDNGTIWSDGMRMWDNAQRIEFTRRVRAEFGGRSNKADSG